MKLVRRNDYIPLNTTVVRKNRFVKALMAVVGMTGIVMILMGATQDDLVIAIAVVIASVWSQIVL